MEQATPIVSNVRQSNTTLQNGQLVASYQVTFTVGSDGPFIIQIPASEFSAAAVQKKIAEFASELGQLPRG